MPIEVNDFQLVPRKSSKSHQKVKVFKKSSKSLQKVLPMQSKTSPSGGKNNIRNYNNQPFLAAAAAVTS